MTLDDLVSQLVKVYGEALHATVLYGSAVAGERIPKRSDTNVLVIVDVLDLARLRAEAAIARAWAEAGNPPPLTLTVEEWRGAADIFPMEVADILESHRVLHGSLPLAGMTVDRQNLRLQAEQQALGKLLQLRQGILAAGGDDRRLIELLASSLSTFMVIFRAVLRLHDEHAPADYEQLSARAAARAGFDPDPFQRVVRHVRGESKLSARDLSDVLAGYLSGAQQLVGHINGLGPAPR